MKIMKQSLLALALLSMTANIVPHSNGGAIAAGTIGGFAGGMLLSSAINSGNNRYQDRDTYNLRTIDRKLDRAERELKRAQRDFDRGRISESQLARYEDNYNQLRKERAMASA